MTFSTHYRWRNFVIGMRKIDWQQTTIKRIKAWTVCIFPGMYSTISQAILTHWGRCILAAISRTTLSKIENAKISIKFSFKFVAEGPINNIPALVQIIDWRRPGDKPLSEPMVLFVPTHICVTRPQWVKYNWSILTMGGNVFSVGTIIIAIEIVTMATLFPVCDKSSTSLRRNCCRFGGVFVAGCTGNCHAGNFHCGRLRKLRRNGDFIGFSFWGITSELFDEFAYWFLNYQPSFYYCTAILLITCQNYILASMLIGSFVCMFVCLFVCDVVPPYLTNESSDHHQTWSTYGTWNCEETYWFWCWWRHRWRHQV